MICKNCGTEFEGNYCNRCGQKATVGRLTWKSVCDNLLHGIFHVDNTFIKTTRMLVVHPDRLISDYFEGRRKGYMAPIPLLAVWCVILLFFGHIKGLPGSTPKQQETPEWFDRLLNHSGVFQKATVLKSILSASVTRQFR